MDQLSFYDLIEEGQNGDAIYISELVSTETVSVGAANLLSLGFGSDGAFFDGAFFSE